MIITGPLQVPSIELCDQALHRRDALLALGARHGRGIRYVWLTASAWWDEPARRLLIATDPDCAADDWNEVCEVLSMAGWMAGKPGYDDIGEPCYDRVSRVWVWDLPCP